MALTHAIMTALLEERLSGYELTKSFDTSLGFFWKASHQQIYKALRDMEQKGWLASEEVPQAGRPDKVIYQLTKAGKAELDSWVMGASQFRESKDDLYIKLYNLAPENVEHLQQELAQRARETGERLTLYRRIRERHYVHPETLSLRRRGIYLTLQAGIRHCEMYLQWIDESLQLLGAGEPTDTRTAADC